MCNSKSIPTDPPPLGYHTPTADPQEPDLDIPACSFAFAIANWITEIISLYLVIFRLGVLSTGHPHKQFVFDVFTETIWTVPAFIAVLIAQFVLRPRKGANRRLGLWPMAMILGVMYSLSRWMVWWFARPSNSNDFRVAMLLAAIVGVILAAIRRRWV